MRHPYLDVVWVLMCGILVFMMQAGFMCLEVGLVRQKNSINVAIKNVTDFLISSVSFFLIGFALMFGSSFKGLIGTDGWLLFKYTQLDQEGWIYTFWFFQMVFCGASATIVSGGVAERMRFSGYMIISFIISTFIYPVFGHWAWGGNYDLAPGRGWLAALGYKDFAGSSVVHMVGGITTLACLLVLGPRKGKYNPDGTANKIWGCDIPMSTLGVFLLWFGWFGFNGGSTLAVNKDIARIIINTNLAACTGALSCLFFTWMSRKSLDVGSIINGALGGLVAITASCAYVTPESALMIGIIAGPVLILVEKFLDRFHIDDAVGAVPVHGACGILGIICVGLFAQPEYLVNQSRVQQISVQVLGAAVCFFYTFTVAWLFMKGMDRYITPLRVPPDAEEKGLNISEHGARTVWFDLAEDMHYIEKTQDLSKRTVVESETEVGVVAAMFNKLMNSLEQKTRELQEAQAQIIQSVKMAAIGKLAGGVAHEINNPLGVILGFSQNVAKRIKPGDPFEMPMKSIEREALRCKNLVQDLLNFSRVGKLEKESVDLSETIESALSLIFAQTKVKNVDLIKELDRVPKILANRNQIQQIIINLSNNAMDAMAEGGKLIVRVKELKCEGGNFVTLEVADTGGGISPEIRSKIFDPFFTTKEIGKGTGLGLSLVYEIVEKHNGKISVDSEVGNGTTFRVVLPLESKN